MEELKKCPFCGGEAMLKINYGFDEKVIAWQPLPKPYKMKENK